MKIEKDTSPIPCWALGYIFNAEIEGITEEEIKLIDSFLSDIETINPPNEEPYFHKINFWGLATNFQDCETTHKQQQGEE